jgi:starch synthase (maltosyl-transferring)
VAPRTESRVGTRVGRIPITGLRPRTPDDLFDTKAFAGEVVPFQATVFREGHDIIDAALVIADPTGSISRSRMTPGIPGTDLWSSEHLFEAEDQGAARAGSRERVRDRQRAAPEGFTS